LPAGPDTNLNGRVSKREESDKAGLDICRDWHPVAVCLCPGIREVIVTGSDEATEIINEFVMESARADEGRSPAQSWHRRVAISTLFMALITAAGALLAGITAHETLIDRTQEMIDISIARTKR
jgi:hypothetical protein